MESETVALSPSGSSRKFNVHKGLLQQKCPVLHAACVNFREGEESFYDFESEVSEGTLIRFIQWAYASDYQEEVETTKSLVLPDNAESVASAGQEDSDIDENHPLLLHGRLYVFADTYIVNDLKALALKKLRVKLRPWGQPSDSTRLASVVDLLDFAFGNLHPDDQLLDFLGKYAAKNITNLRKQKAFNDAIWGMGSSIIQYVQPWSGDPFKLPDGTYD